MTKLKKLQNSKNQMVTKLKNSICDNTQNFKLGQNLNYDQSQFMKKEITLKGSFSKNNLTY